MFQTCVGPEFHYLCAPSVKLYWGDVNMPHTHLFKKVDHDVMMRDCVPEAVFAAHKVVEAQLIMLHKCCMFVQYMFIVILRTLLSGNNSPLMLFFVP